MKRTLVAVAASAFAGAWVATLLTAPPGAVETSAGAQEHVAQNRSAPLSSRQIAPDGIAPDGFATSRPAPTGFAQADDLDASLSPDERANIAVYEQTNQGVVHIDTRSQRNDLFFLGDAQEGSGSGSVIDDAGHILTNFHVIEGARQISVTLADDGQYVADVVGVDPTTDIAVLKIDAPAASLHPIAFGDSSRLRVGQKVFAIGNPFGLDRTLSTGVVSSLDRMLPSRNHRKLKSIIQIDAAINPGNSGGPLLDSRGRLIGMNTAIAARSEQSAGIGFAIPERTISRIVALLIEQGRVVRADIGILAVRPTSEGLMVMQLEPGGPAEQAGLQGPRVVRTQRGPFVYEKVDRSQADILAGVDDTPIDSVDSLLTVVESKQPGDAVTLYVLRDGKPRSVSVTLDADD
ncbi:MAG: trypsin-like peptidase domain-containing protein [Pirellulales bacterium]